MKTTSFSEEYYQQILAARKKRRAVLATCLNAIPNILGVVTGVAVGVGVIAGLIGGAEYLIQGQSAHQQLAARVQALEDTSHAGVFMVLSDSEAVPPASFSNFVFRANSKD